MLAEQIARTKSITIEANANEAGDLYGSVGPQEISRGMRGKNLLVEPDMIKLEEPLRHLGEWPVPINLGYDIETQSWSPSSRSRPGSGNSAGRGRRPDDPARRRDPSRPPDRTSPCLPKPRPRPPPAAEPGRRAERPGVDAAGQRRHQRRPADPADGNFYFDAHQKIFQAIVDLYNEGQPSTW